MKEKTANCHRLLRTTEEIKVSGDWFGCVIVIPLYERVLGISVSPNCLLVSPRYDLTDLEGISALDDIGGELWRGGIFK